MNLSRLQAQASHVSAGVLWWRNLNHERPVTVVMYHSVSPEPGPWTINPVSFERQIRFLNNTYRIIPLKNVREALLGRFDRRTLVMTFDDAYQDFAEYAHPILESIGVPSTLFVPAGYIGKWNEWDAPIDGIARKPIMNLGELRRIAASPCIEIGSHTVDHARMSVLSFQEVWRQAAGSRRLLERLLGCNVSHFSYPWGQLGDFSNLTRRVLAEAGYRTAVTSRWGSTNSIRQLLALRRISCEEADTLADLRAKVEGEYDWYALKEWAGYAKRKFAMRDKVRHNPIHNNITSPRLRRVSGRL